MDYRKASNTPINGLNRRHSLSSAARPFSDHNSGAAVHPPLMNFAGLLQPPPTQVVHLPPNFSSFHSYPQYAMREQKQPPLLPLPVSPPANHRTGITRGASLPPTSAAFGGGNRKTQIKPNSFRSRDSASLTPKKSITKGASEISNGVRDAQKKVAAVNEFSFSLSESGMFAAITPPPPSSLPLPTFSLRPKRSCTAQAGGVVIDAGATDNLCRLLHLQ